MAQILNWLRVPSGQDPRHERPPRDGEEYLAPSLRLTFKSDYAQDHNELKRAHDEWYGKAAGHSQQKAGTCLLYTSPSPRDY